MLSDDFEARFMLTTRDCMILKLQTRDKMIKKKTHSILDDTNVYIIAYMMLIVDEIVVKLEILKLMHLQASRDLLKMRPS